MNAVDAVEKHVGLERDLLLRHRKAQVWKTLKQRADADAQLHAGEVLSDTLMDAETEADVSRC